MAGTGSAGKWGRMSKMKTYQGFHFSNKLVPAGNFIQSMRRRATGLAALVWLFANEPVARADQLLQLAHGTYQFLTCEVDGNGGNSVINSSFFAVPPSMSDVNGVNNLLLIVWDCNSLSRYQYFTGADADAAFGLGGSPGGFYDISGVLQDGIFWNPGTGMILYNFVAPTNIVLHGTAHVPVLPVSLPCPCGSFNLIGDQTNEVSLFENITGFSPPDGAQLFAYIPLTNGVLNLPPGNNYTTFTFCGGGWFPNLPVVNPAQAVWVVTPCPGNPCISVQMPNVVIVSTQITPVSFSPVVNDTCGSIGSTNFNIVCNPPSGSLFAPGTTPVHCVAVDGQGNSASCDFSVTIAPPPLAPPVTSYTIPITSGLNLIANQLDTGGNTLREVIPIAPDGSVALKYNNTAGFWARSVFNAAFGAWVPANITLSPGEGMFFQSPTNFNLTFTGRLHTPVLPINIPTNSAYLLSLQTPDFGTYDTIVGTNPINGAKLYRWNGVGYVVYRFAFGSWTPSTPTLNVGESAWISPSGAAPSTPPTPPSISSQPSSIAVSNGSQAGFSVTASGSAPLRYVWRLNGNNIIGATDSSLNFTNTQPTNCGTYNVAVFNSIGIVDSVSVSLTLDSLPALPSGNTFATAGSLSPAAGGVAKGTNTSGVFESGEPAPGNIPGGSPIWMNWTPASSGVATISTAGSGLDTLLAIYTGTNLNNLTLVASDDDSAGFLCSAASFNAMAGTNYLIQVDGFYGARGNLVVSWSLAPTTNQLPVILTPPHSQTVGLGAPATLSVSTPALPPLNFQWFQNGIAISNATSPELDFPAVSNASVGVYSVTVTDPNSLLSVTPMPVLLEINIPALGATANTNARAEDKFLSATDTSRVGTADPYDPSIVTGYTGTQIFSTFGSSSDPNEPEHCGLPTCQTYWNGYLATNTGTLTISDAGTAFNAVLAVYTGPNTSYLTLIPVACSSGHSPGQESVTFDVIQGTNYWVVLGGVPLADNSCPTGNTQINYSLYEAPLFNTLPVSQTQTNGVNVTLTASANGTPNLGYQWMYNGIAIAGATGTSYVVTNLQTLNEGYYSIMATNNGGTNLFNAATVFLNNPLEFVNSVRYSNFFYSQLLCVINTNYIFQSSTNIGATNWVPVRTNSSPIGVITFTNAIPPGVSNLYFRAKRF
jgi:hypothetical protein